MIDDGTKLRRREGDVKMSRWNNIIKGFSVFIYLSEAPAITTLLCTNRAKVLVLGHSIFCSFKHSVRSSPVFLLLLS